MGDLIIFAQHKLATIPETGAFFRPNWFIKDMVLILSLRIGDHLDRDVIMMRLK